MLGVSLLSFVVIRRSLKKHKLSEKSFGKSQTNVRALVGKRATVIGLFDADKKGRVKVGGEEWVAQLEGDIAVALGEHVEIVDVRGNRVIVKPIVKEGIEQ